MSGNIPAGRGGTKAGEGGSIRYDPPLVATLAAELNAVAAGRPALELWMDPEARSALLLLGPREAGDALLRIAFFLHPEAGQIVADAALAASLERRLRAPRPESRGNARPARVELGGRPLRSIHSPPDERLLQLELGPTPGGDEGTGAGGREGAGETGEAEEPARAGIVVELLTNQWNLLLVEGAEDRVRGVLRPRQAGGRELRPGRLYHPPEGGRRGAERPVGEEEWRTLLGPAPPEERPSLALRELAGMSSVNVEAVLGAAARDREPEALAAAFRRYRRLRAGEDPAAWLLARPWGPQPYPFSLGEADAEPAPSLLEAMARAGRAAGLAARFGIPGGGAEGTELPPGDAPPLRAGRPSAAQREARRVAAALLEERDRLRRRRRALRRELERGAEPAALRRTGDLLLARLSEIPRGAASVELEDFDGTRREVSLDPALAPSENAERYYARAAKRERAAEALPRRIDRTDRALAELGEALEELGLPAETDPGELPPAGEISAPPPERLAALWERAGGGRAAEGAGGGEGPDTRRPYRVLVSSGGLEIRVGRGARDNDALTFHHSSPEDVWLHARQVPGAHVILRWGRRDQNPPRRDLLEAAVAAAVHSDARHSGSVGVDWTRRKYVRKPRKAPPGAVVPERSQTVFVEPDAALVERLRRD